MPAIAITGQRRIVRFRILFGGLHRVFPAHFGFVVVRFRVGKFPLPVCGPLRAVEQIFQRGHSGVVQVRRGRPDAVERRRDVAVVGQELAFIGALAVPAVVVPSAVFRVFLVCHRQERIGAHFFKADEQVGVRHRIAVGAVAFVAGFFKNLLPRSG